MLRSARWPGRCLTQGEGKCMKYIIAWGLGVPGGIIVLWFLLNHLH